MRSPRCARRRRESHERSREGRRAREGCRLGAWRRRTTGRSTTSDAAAQREEPTDQRKSDHDRRKGMRYTCRPRAEKRVKPIPAKWHQRRQAVRGAPGLGSIRFSISHVDQRDPGGLQQGGREQGGYALRRRVRAHRPSASRDQTDSRHGHAERPSVSAQAAGVRSERGDGDSEALGAKPPERRDELDRIPATESDDRTPERCPAGTSARRRSNGTEG